jgi:hypothetical protein
MSNTQKTRKKEEWRRREGKKLLFIMKLLFFIFLFLLGLGFLCLGPVKLSSSLSLVVFLRTSALQLETVRESYTHTDTHTRHQLAT